ncbi:hypothetical protein LJY25_12560 [Hymenobacter sp. BT175]|uniref:hypothetical protein n=1 Tax=Hymenobacter translucens TaxID=2886507 RepID=UPI001D0E5E7A|nr:hypothetical protein [Hymenobacter translucens]MCC2547280.1 hypothetical protein [Hymenobacter translucens]
MTLRTLFEAEYLTVSFDYLNEWFYLDWKGEQDLASVQQGCEQVWLLFQNEQCRRAINDTSHVTGMWSDAAEWVGREFLPQVADAGLEYIAWVYSPDVYSRLSTDLTLQMATKPVVVAFDDLPTAIAWLKQM